MPPRGARGYVATQARHQIEGDLAGLAGIDGHEHDLVADQLHHPAVPCGRNVVRGVLEALDQRGQLGGRDAARQWREAHQVDEPDGEERGADGRAVARLGVAGPAGAADGRLHLLAEDALHRSRQDVEQLDGPQVRLGERQLRRARLDAAVPRCSPGRTTAPPRRPGRATIRRRAKKRRVASSPNSRAAAPNPAYARTSSAPNTRSSAEAAGSPTARRSSCTRSGVRPLQRGQLRQA